MIDDGFQCLFVLATSPQAGAVISFAGGGHGTPAEYGHVAFVEKLYPRLIPYLRNQLQWQSKLYLP